MWPVVHSYSENLVAESVTSNAKQKVNSGQKEIKKKAIQIKTISEKLDEMDRFAMGTNYILNEMRQRVEDLVEETSRQRQRAVENEQELTRVKQEIYKEMEECAKWNWE
ncbi:hypothetical protein L1987_07414 [Smallanthus sonchifolius]|uniref:Uncharacterized protein n=1 Tax=Smallanthus sonchifolius TaxID=185202 RepID=A0ACB9K0L3_9ASTR|nr:hypothetical protein L1987_07414 [Smallanthus sonchifolius]